MSSNSHQNLGQSDLFLRRLWAWQFSKAKTSGIGARIGALEGAATNHTFEAKAFEPYQEPVVDEKARDRSLSSLPGV